LVSRLNKSEQVGSIEVGSIQVGSEECNAKLIELGTPKQLDAYVDAQVMHPHYNNRQRQAIDKLVNKAWMAFAI
jgi:hypothetical protein